MWMAHQALIEPEPTPVIPVVPREEAAGSRPLPTHGIASGHLKLWTQLEPHSGILCGHFCSAVMMQCIFRALAPTSGAFQVRSHGNKERLNREAQDMQQTHIYIPAYLHTHMRSYVRNYIHATHIHTCIYIRTYIHTYINTYIHTYIHTYTHTHIHTYTRTHIPTYLHTYIHPRIHIHTHTYIRTRTYIHTYMAHIHTWHTYIHGRHTYTHSTHT